MKKLSMILTFLVIFGSSAIGHTSEERVVFEGTFERGNIILERAISSKKTGNHGNGTPVTQSRNFLGSSGEATLKVCNGPEAEKISSAEISINGNVVLGSSTFNQNVDCINKTVNLKDGGNILEVELKSKPGGKVSIEISQPDSDDTDGYPYLVIDTDDNLDGIQGIPVGNGPSGVSVKPYEALPDGTLSDRTFVYVTNFFGDTVSVIDTSTNTALDFDPNQDGNQGIPLEIGSGPFGVSVTPDGAFVYVANYYAGSVSVIDTAVNEVITEIPLEIGSKPSGVSVKPYEVLSDGTLSDGTFVYVTNNRTGSVSVIDTAVNEVITEIPLEIGSKPSGVSVTPDGAFVYVTNNGTGSVSVIDTAVNEVITEIPLEIGSGPLGVSVTPDGTFVYVTNNGTGSVSVIDTAVNEVIAEIPVGSYPYGISVTPNGKYAYVNNVGDNTVSVIDTSNNTVIDDTDPNQDGFQEIQVGLWPYSGIAVTPDGKFVYVGNYGDDTVSVIGF